MHFKLILLVAIFVHESMTGAATCGNRPDAVTGCSQGPSEGARRLATYLKNKYGGRTEIFNCRPVRGSQSTLSLHSEGRAVDLYLDIPTGTRAFNEMQNKDGVQEVIFNRKIWTASGGLRAYNGVHPHTDHVHIGLNKCGALNWRA